MFNNNNQNTCINTIRFSCPSNAVVICLSGPSIVMCLLCCVDRFLPIVAVIIAIVANLSNSQNQTYDAGYTHFMQYLHTLHSQNHFFCQNVGKGGGGGGW